MFICADSIILTRLSMLNSFKLTNMNLANMKIYKPKQAPKLAYSLETPKEKWDESQSSIVAYAEMKSQ